MKKLIIIAIVALLAVPAMAVQIIGPSPSPSGTIPVMMTIDRYAEIILPDQIVLTSADEQDLTAPWSNTPGDDMLIKANFDCEIQVLVTAEPAYVSIGTFDPTLSSTSAILSAAAGIDLGNYATAMLWPDATPTWEPLTILIELTGVDLTNAAYSPTAVQVAHVDVTVVSQ